MKGFFTAFVVDPLMHLVLLLVLFFTLRALGRKRLARICLGFLAGWAFLIYVSPVPLLLCRELEGRYRVLADHDVPDTGPANIMVMGGGHTSSQELQAANQLEVTALGRLAEGIRIYRLLPGSKVVCSGSSSTGKTTQAELQAMAALGLGVEVEDTIRLQSPRNTSEEAKAYVARFGRSIPLIIVTSAIHMPRAVRTFEKEGLYPIPAPTNHFVKNIESSVYDFRPSLLKVTIMGKAMKEYLALFFL